MTTFRFAALIFLTIVSNGGFTQALIADTLLNGNFFRGLFGRPQNQTWEDQANNIYLDRNEDAGIINEYTGMNGSISVKQADIVLITFPLNFQLNYTREDSLNDLEYYAGKQSLSGPGMTYMIFSVGFSTSATSGCGAYTYQQYSEHPYARAPWFFFSEQLTDDFSTNGGTHPAYPFLTGHGGANQVTLFGYLGLRLTPSFVLHLDPTLPPQIPNLRYRVFHWQGWPISASSNQTHTTVTRLSQPYSYITSNMTYANTSIPVQIGNNGRMYELPPKGTIVLPNRRTADNATIDGNVAQCLPVSSPDGYRPGQFPLSAVDGTPSTKWQPLYANQTQSITISLGSQAIQPITSFVFDFGQIPPTNLTVLFHNTSSLSSAVVAVRANISISVPYDPAEAAVIKPYESNTTVINLKEPVYSGTYATLQILGSLADPSNNATGATVAEWAIVGQEGQRLDLGEGDGAGSSAEKRESHPYWSQGLWRKAVRNKNWDVENRGWKRDHQNWDVENRGWKRTNQKEDVKNRGWKRDNQNRDVEIKNWGKEWKRDNQNGDVENRGW